MSKKVDLLDNYLFSNRTIGMHVATSQSMEIVYTMINERKEKKNETKWVEEKVKEFNTLSF